jgi:hypothetical protein
LVITTRRRDPTKPYNTHPNTAPKARNSGNGNNASQQTSPSTARVSMGIRPAQRLKLKHLKTRDSLWDKITRVAELQNYLQGDAHGGNSF